MKMLPHVGGARMEVMHGGSVIPAEDFVGSVNLTLVKNLDLVFN